MKELFLDTEIEIVLFPQSDIITTSGGSDLDENELPFVPAG